ncbi:MFS general substrate transporter [Jaminaea rosea]|uniref:MFS general substrate transporter n=1 Tax=Jaminaea rosea TaxID=1569628 RepID=A0A316ULH7_9BASI|nr:MFS general substrate transporter [Jaminaea rosea]PWN25794.1 MFS general substrate transporter [Jaminaea rosea]
MEGKDNASLASLPSRRNIVRRIDILLLPLLTICYGLQFYDKAVLGSATIFGILDDLELATVSGGKRDLSRYSAATAAFYYGYVGAVIPASFLAQRLRPNYFLGGAIFLWGFIVLLTPAIASWQGLIAQRVFLGAVESTVSPGFLLVTRRFWTRQEMPMRVGVWYSATGLFSVFSGLVNYGLGTRSHPGIATWKTLFLVPGFLTVFFGAVVLLFLPPEPARDAVIKVPGYNTFSPAEREAMLRATRLEALGRESDKWEWSQVLEALCDYKVWIYFLLATAIYVCNGGVTVFGPLLIKSFGYSSTRAILLQTPGGAVTVVAILLACWMSLRFRNARLLILALSCLPVILGAALIWAPSVNWQKHQAMPLIGYYLLPAFGAPYVMLLSSLAANVAGTTKASFAAGAVFVGYNVGNIASAYILLPSEASVHYATTWKIIISMMCASIGLAGILAGAMTWENRRRDKRAERDGSSVPPTPVEGQQEKKLDSDAGLNKDVEATSSDAAAAVEQRDLTDWQNKAFRYVL